MCRFYQAGRHTAEMAAKYPEPLRPNSVLPWLGRRDPSPGRQLLLRHRSYWLMCHSRWSLSSFGIEPRSKSLCRLYAVPAAHGSFPTLSPIVFPWMLDPLPRRYTVCSHLFLPRCHRPSPRESGSAFRVYPTNYDFSQDRFSRTQIFRNVPASKFARPPDRTYRCEYSRRAARASTSGPIVLCYLRTHRIC